MAKRYTRRSALERGLKGSLLALGSTSHLWTRTVGSVWAEVAETAGNSQDPVLSSKQRGWLAAVAGQIVPAGDGMPGANDVGAVDYIDVVLRDVPELRAKVTAALDEIQQVSKSTFQKEPGQLSAAQLVEVLKAFEKKSAPADREETFNDAGGDLFAALRDLVYEGYYTNPEIWPRLGYKFDSVEVGTTMKAFDEGILSVVRKRPRHYRETE